MGQSTWGQIKNIKLHIVTDIKVDRKTTTNKMETLTNNIGESEKTLAFLREQMSILTALAAKKRQSDEAEEIKRLVAENEQLAKDLITLKENLQYYEVQNGIAQVHVPKCKSDATAVAPAAEMQQPKQQPQQQQQQQKGKGEKVKKEKQPKPQAPPAAAVDVDVSKLNMKVGKIVSVEKHPDADTLYVEQVDVGEEKHRQVVSGLVKSYTLEQMQDRVGVFLLNLKPAKMRGVLSEGMIMCASSPDKVETLEVPTGAVIGDRVVCPGYPGEPDDQLNPKKKHWEAIAKDLAVTGEGVASYKGDLFTITGKGNCTAPTMRGCIIK